MILASGAALCVFGAFCVLRSVDIGVSIVVLILSAVIISAVLIVNAVENESNNLCVGELKLAYNVDKLLFLRRSRADNDNGAFVCLEMTAASITAATGGVSMNI